MAVRHYRLSITTAGPLHIGNGETCGKRDYFVVDRSHVAVLDMPRFVAELDDGQLDEYCRFLAADAGGSLEQFLDSKGLMAIARRHVRYQVDTPLARAPRGQWNRLAVAQFVKDAHGCPYVPGSSVKGMLRTAILAHLILADPARYAPLYDRGKALDRSTRRSACMDIEREAFWREHPDPYDDKVASDIMRHVSASDSAPLPTDALVFARKYDKFAKSDPGAHKRRMGNTSVGAYNEGNELNIYRECVRPGTDIELTLDVDDRIDAHLGGLALDARGLVSVLEEGFGLYRRRFLDKFDLGGVEGAGTGGGADDGNCRYVIASGPLKGRRCPNKAVGGTGYCNTHREHAAPAVDKAACYLGGGTDFNTKTVANALLGDGRGATYEISRILYAQFPTQLDPSRRELRDEVLEAGFEPEGRRFPGRQRKQDHRHWKDTELGVSPHTVKLGIIGGKPYLMGRCSLAIEEVR